MTPIIFGHSVWSLLHITHLVPRILRWLPTFLQNCSTAGIRQWVSVPKISVLRLTGQFTSDSQKFVWVVHHAHHCHHTPNDDILLHLTQQANEFRTFTWWCTTFLWCPSSFWCWRYVKFHLWVPPIQKLISLCFLTRNSKSRLEPNLYKHL